MIARLTPPDGVPLLVDPRVRCFSLCAPSQPPGSRSATIRSVTRSSSFPSSTERRPRTPETEHRPGTTGARQRLALVSARRTITVRQTKGSYVGHAT